MRVVLSLLLLLYASSAVAEGWIDIAAAIANREAQMVPAVTGESSAVAGEVFAESQSAEFVADGRIFDSFFWHEAYSAFVGISPKRHPGMVFSFR